MIRTGDQSNNPILFDGDTIKISKLTDKKIKLKIYQITLLLRQLKYM